MKRVTLAVLAALTVSSCTPVESFGAYWDKGIVDPALEGTWKKVGLPGEAIDSIPGPATLRFVRDGTAYLMQGLNPTDPAAPSDVRAQQQVDDDRQSAVRTLRIGTALLMMVGSPGGEGPGLIMRYDIHGATLREYWIENSHALAFLAIRHPGAKNIRRNVGEGAYVVIGTFDDDVFRVLSEMTASPANWRLHCEYRKIPARP
jgi:hypothetical protein